MCANYSHHEWNVATVDGKVRATRRLTGDKTDDPLPFVIAPAEGMKGRRRVVRVSDGWIVGFDAGEWDGSLWWFSADGTSRRELLASERDEQHLERWFPQNVRAILRVNETLLVFQGLAHLGINMGRVAAVAVAAPHHAHLLGQLPGSPKVAIVDGTDGALVVTNDRLLRVNTAGAMTLVARLDLSGLYPSSVVRAATGEVFIGMRHFVVRIMGEGDQSKTTWFVPADCTTFKTRDLKCVCSLPAGSEPR